MLGAGLRNISVQGRSTESLKLQVHGAAVYPSPLTSFEYLELMDKVNLGKHFIEEQLIICDTPALPNY